MGETTVPWTKPGVPRFFVLLCGRRKAMVIPAQSLPRTPIRSRNPRGRGECSPAEDYARRVADNPSSELRLGVRRARLPSAGKRPPLTRVTLGACRKSPRGGVGGAVRPRHYQQRADSILNCHVVAAVVAALSHRVVILTAVAGARTCRDSPSPGNSPPWRDISTDSRRNTRGRKHRMVA